MAIAPLFNAYWYLQQNPDVAQAVSAGLIDARTHFELFGRQEGREASPLFDVAAYLEDNPDVAAAVAAGQMNVHEHFERWGCEEDSARYDCSMRPCIWPITRMCRRPFSPGR